MRGKKPSVATLILLSLIFFGLTGRALANASAQFKQAEAYQNNRQYEQAEAIYQQIITAFPDTNDALEAQKQLILIYITTDKQEQADAAFEKLTAGFSQNKDIAEAIWQIAKKYEEAKQPEKSFQIHQYNVGHFPDEMCAMWSQVEIVYYYIFNGSPTGADAAFNDLVTLFSGQPTLPREIYQMAVMYTMAGKADKSLQLHQYNISHFPNDKYALFSQVDCHIIQGDDASAQAEFDKLVSLFSGQPFLAEAIWQVGKTYSAAKKFDSAYRVHTYNVAHFPETERGMWSQVEIVNSHIRDG